MHYLFVQPRSHYPISNNLTAYSLTFPQLVADLQLEESEYSVFIEDLAQNTIEEVIRSVAPSHVLITAITSTFPSAIRIATIASKHGCVVVLGGIIATLNAKRILAAYDVFDFVVEGCPTINMLSLVASKPREPSLLRFGRQYRPRAISPVILHDSLCDVFQGERVCYELSCGCPLTCSFCSLYRFRGNFGHASRSLTEVQRDLARLAVRWPKLKLIDADVMLSIDTLSRIRLRPPFKEVVVETRLESVVDSTCVVALRDAGVSHVIFGVEAFSDDCINGMGKCTELLGTRRVQAANTALENLLRAGITPRPVLMLTAPGMTLEELDAAEKVTRLWTIGKGTELLLAFYTPHPGVCPVHLGDRLLTTDLAYFDHLNPVYIPSPMPCDSLKDVLGTYDLIVANTSSEAFNPPIILFEKRRTEFDGFFLSMEGESEAYNTNGTTEQCNPSDHVQPSALR